LNDLKDFQQKKKYPRTVQNLVLTVLYVPCSLKQSLYENMAQEKHLQKKCSSKASSHQVASIEPDESVAAASAGVPPKIITLNPKPHPLNPTPQTLNPKF
jgi:hypothetical protein